MQIVRTTENQLEKKCEIHIDYCPEWTEETKCIYRENDYGLAVDIGTTTIAMSCYRLHDRKWMGNYQEMNSQCMMGSDVVMRLMHCVQGKQERLQRLVIEQLEDMAGKICKDICAIKDIKKMTVVGNAAMCHIFAGQDAAGLAGSPFRTAYKGTLRYKGDILGFQSLSGADIIILPGIESHVGADTTAMMACVPIHNSTATHIAIDIGTNAEIVLHHKGEDIVCSAPAGPAFEGMEISCGMRGIKGAIAGVKLAPQTGNLVLNVIGPEGTRPIGLCGSGLVDAVAQLLQCGLIQRDGYLLTADEAREQGITEKFIERLEKDAFVLYQDETTQENKVSLTREDIRQFQLAKASVQAGIKMLLSSREISVSQVNAIWVAGEFGKYISKTNAVKTGMFPKELEEKIYVVGNAAGVGAAQALLDENFCLVLEEIAAKSKHLELAESENFRQEFIAAMELGY